jgi:hypothetical protein
VGPEGTIPPAIAPLWSLLAAYGALRLELYGNGLVYRYINTAGTTLDTGSILCSGASGLVPPLSLYLPFIAR